MRPASERRCKVCGEWIDDIHIHPTASCCTACRVKQQDSARKTYDKYGHDVESCLERMGWPSYLKITDILAYDKNLLGALSDLGKQKTIGLCLKYIKNNKGEQYVRFTGRHSTIVYALQKIN